MGMVNLLDKEKRAVDAGSGSANGIEPRLDGEGETENRNLEDRWVAEWDKTARYENRSRQPASGVSTAEWKGK